MRNQVLLSSYFNTQYETPFYLDTENQNQMEVPMIFNTGLTLFLSSIDHIFKVSLDIYNFTDEKFSSISNDAGAILQTSSNGYLGVPLPGRRYYLSFLLEM